MDGILLAVIEFQSLIQRLEERLSLIDKREDHYSCPTMSSKRRGRPTLVISEEQLDGLRSPGVSWSGIAKLLGVSEKTIRRRRDSDFRVLTGLARLLLFPRVSLYLT